MLLLASLVPPDGGAYLLCAVRPKGLTRTSLGAACGPVRPGAWRLMINRTSIVIGDNHRVFLDALAMVLAGRGFTPGSALW